MADALEQILASFEKKNLFEHPLRHCRLHDDVTIKYPLSMLALAGEKKTDVLDTFATRFHADREELEQLFHDVHNWVSYEFYVAFSVHCQQQLELDDQTFFQQAARKTFLNYQDQQIAVARYVPINLVLKGMGKQMINWTKVTDTKVEKRKFEGSAFRITRRTKDEYKRRLEAIIGKDLLKDALKRDCDFTLTAFQTTFQELFQQPDLYVQKEACEANAEQSIYIVHPTSPHNPWYLQLFYRAVTTYREAKRRLTGILNPWGEKRKLQQVAFAQEQTIRQRTTSLEHANAELAHRQDVIVKLLTEIARIRSSGDRHGVRNFLATINVKEEQRIFTYIAQELQRTYTISTEHPTARTYLTAMCNIYGIDVTNPPSQTYIVDQLHFIDINKAKDQSPAAGIDNIGDLFDGLSDLFGINLDRAAEQAQEIKKNLKVHPLEGFDPFQLLYSLRSFKEVMREINAKFAETTEMSFLDRFPLSSALETAIQDAQKEKKVSISVITNLTYDPTFSTSRSVVVYMLRDLFYNAIDAGASQITIQTQHPTREQTPPYLHELGFDEGEFPQLYIVVEDNAGGITPAKTVELMDYLQGIKTSASSLSTKGKTENEGGLGTKNLKQLLDLHAGKAYYESYTKDTPEGTTKGTRIHIYLGQLKI